MKIALLQISDKYFPKDDIYKNIELFYDTKRKDGYYKHDDFIEYPTWILQIAKVLKCETELVIIENDSELMLSTKANYVLCSVMNSNVDVLTKIIKLNSDINFIVGGYCSIELLDNIIRVSSIGHLGRLLNMEHISNENIGYDYSIFSTITHKIYTIPRLQLSIGCNLNCKFCTVSHTVITNSFKSIRLQVDSFRFINFKLIYIDDKSFGQASNHILLIDLYKYIKSFNSKFEGFIIQTSFVDYVKYLSDNTELLECVKVVEFGLETYNQNISKVYNKNTFTTYKDTIDNIINDCLSFDIRIIFNIIIGFPEETWTTYKNTVEFIKKNKQYIYNLNIYPYTDYDNNESETSYNLEGIHLDALNTMLEIQREIIQQ